MEKKQSQDLQINDNCIICELHDKIEKATHYGTLNGDKIPLCDKHRQATKTKEIVNSFKDE